MKQVNLIIFLLFLFNIQLFAQNTIQVETIETITTPDQGLFFMPKFTPDGKSILVTEVKFTGLFSIDLKTKSVTALTKEIGAGYDFQISPDGQYVLYRPFIFKKGRKFYSLKMLNLKNKELKTLEHEVRNLSPARFVDNEVVYLKNNAPQKVVIGTHINQFNQSVKRAVFIRNRTIILVEDGDKKELKPLGEGIYLWPQISPDGTKLVFTFAGDGTYVSDLDGQILSKIGYANAPSWAPNSQWIAYMVDHDDGHFYTDSEIYVSSWDGKKKIQITNTSDVIEMYPDWSSQDLTRLVFSSLKGQIFLATLKIK